MAHVSSLQQPSLIEHSASLLINDTVRVSGPIKCFCNDESLCSSTSQSLSQVFGSVNSSDASRAMSTFLEKSRLPFQYCVSQTICLTKRLLKPDGNTQLKYSCDHHTLTSPNSIRQHVIEYRDCKIDTDNERDRQHALKNFEHCCSGRDFCNIDLAPTKFVRDINDFTNYNFNNHKNINNNNYNNNKNNNNHNNIDQNSNVNSLNGTVLLPEAPFINTTNIVLLSLCGIVAITFVFLIAIYALNRRKFSSMSRAKKYNNNNHGNPNLAGMAAHPSSLVNTQITSINQATTTTGSSQGGSSSSSTSSNSAPSPYSILTTSTSLNSKEISLNSQQQTAATSAAAAAAKSALYTSEPKYSEQFEPLLLSSTSESMFTTSMPLPSRAVAAYNMESIKIDSPLQSTTQSMMGGGGGGADTTRQEAQSGMGGTGAGHFEWSGSGSGAGMPQCVQRTVARQIKLVYPCIGKGRFGEVYKGEWRGEHVAVKTFNSADEKSWENECNIYNTSGFRHENILGFIAADNIDRGLYTELWLITEYHANGSLHDYLCANRVSPEQGAQMLLSIVNGLVHLHMPIESYKGKPALAHCDLKSKNILVKANLTCCIGDLGLAVSGDKDGRVVLAAGTSLRTGTKRYLAPELLTNTLDQRFLNAFQKAEIYSLALIMWEVLRACKFESHVVSGAVYSFDYKLPYFEYMAASGDPDEALMRKIVCEQRLRPTGAHQWYEHPIMHELTKLCEEVWVEKPNERLNALRIKKSITKIIQTNNATTATISQP